MPREILLEALISALLRRFIAAASQLPEMRVMSVIVFLRFCLATHHS